MRFFSCASRARRYRIAAARGGSMVQSFQVSCAEIGFAVEPIDLLNSAIALPSTLHPQQLQI